MSQRYDSLRLELVRADQRVRALREEIASEIARVLDVLVGERVAATNRALEMTDDVAALETFRGAIDAPPFTHLKFLHRWSTVESAVAFDALVAGVVDNRADALRRSARSAAALTMTTREGVVTIETRNGSGLVIERVSMDEPLLRLDESEIIAEARHTTAAAIEALERAVKGGKADA